MQVVVVVCDEWEECEKCEEDVEDELGGVLFGVLFDVLGVVGYKECANVPGVK